LKEDNLTYRLLRARETYQDAVYLFERGSVNSSINRLYYAAFYATLALFLNSGIEIKSHNGIKLKLGEEFVLKELFQRK
jgi:uncharacterized protein (UPF0332 family)